MTSIFISHGGADKPFARRLADDLEAIGYTTWLDERSIQVGDSIRQSIEIGLENCDFAIVLMSQSALQRPWVNAEIDALLSLQNGGGAKRILPCLIESATIPLLLRDKKYADFRNDYLLGFDQLSKALNSDPDAWMFRGKEFTFVLDFKRLDGSVCQVSKTQRLLAMRDGIKRTTLEWISDGRVEFLGVNFGKIVDQSRHGTLTTLLVDFPRNLALGEEISLTSRAVYHDSFLGDREYWDIHQHFRYDSEAVIVRFLKGRLPRSYWLTEQRGAEKRQLPGTVRSEHQNGRYALVYEIPSPRVLSKYTAHWEW